MRQMIVFFSSLPSVNPIILLMANIKSEIFKKSTILNANVYSSLNLLIFSIVLKKGKYH